MSIAYNPKKVNFADKNIRAVVLYPLTKQKMRSIIFVTEETLEAFSR